VRQGFAITRFAAVVAFAVGQWSTTYAGSSAPSDAKQAPTANDGSSFKVVTVPSEANQPRAEPTVVPHADEEPLPRGSATERLIREAQGDNDSQETGNHVQREEILLPPNTERQVSFSTPFTKVVISDPDVLGVLPIGGHSIVVKALKTGNADILFFNNEDLVRSLEVTVDYNVARSGAVPDREAHFIGPPLALWPMEIHNKALLTSYTSYRCGADGCHYVNELTATEPARLPSGYSTQNFNYRGLEGQGGPPNPSPSPNR
jgi:hypothetical protein